MEKLKQLTEVFQPDGRNLAFVKLDTSEPLTLDEHYLEIAESKLDPNVPDEVRSHFATVQNICLYAWYSYDLYSIVDFLCSTTVELALRERFPSIGKTGVGLSRLLKEAVRAKLIKDKGFSHIRMMRKNQAESLRRYRKILKVRRHQLRKEEDYGEVLAKTIPAIRNDYAHPRMHAIVMPQEALFQLRISSELINQLFADSAKAAVP